MQEEKPRQRTRLAQRRTSAAGQLRIDAARQLLKVYARLAGRREHLLAGLLQGQPPLQWQHYPENDATDDASGFLWFYHCHAPEDRPGADEHGHLHLFARRKLWSRRLRSASEQAFARLTGAPHKPVNARHLLSIGLDAKGVPRTLFTVNSWVTGDLMLGQALTLELLASIRLSTGHADVDAVIASVLRLCQPELRELLQLRDQALMAHPGPGKLDDPALEVLSVVRIDLDARLSELG